MTPPENAGRSGYNVDVYTKAAFTISYDDEQGRLLFSIEVGDDPKTIFLNPNPSDGRRMIEARDEATKVRLGLAVKRVKEYLEAKGSRVELD